MNKDFEKVYNENYLSVLRFCRTLNYNIHDAEDITSQTFLELFSKFQNLDFSEKSPKSWLFTTARFKFYNSIKKSSKLEVSTEFFENYPEIDESFVEKLEDKELCNQIREIIETFPIQTKEIIVMKLFEEMQFNEIASIMESSEAAVKMKFYRAIEKIKEELEKKKKKIIAFPLIFTSIREIGIEEKEKLKFTPFSQLRNRFRNKVITLIAALSLIIISIIIVASFFINQNYNTQKNSVSNNAEIVTTFTPTIAVTLSPTLTETIIPTNTPSVTFTPTKIVVTKTIAPTPTSTPTIVKTTKSYSNATYGFSLTMPINFTYSVFTNPECQGVGEPTGPGILTCDQVTIKDPASGNQLIINIAINNAVTMDIDGSCYGSASIGSATILGIPRSKNPCSANTATTAYNNANYMIKGANRIQAYVFNPAGTAPSSSFITQADGIVSTIK